ncbi:hypothetical protein MA16_Dca010917 [Dendrobium catenatum]|uniref:Survival Motor Neuron Gemin2-binding domain-containing protein n=1 Tax=Dendrobium catenatum TaxID=906689 RepID=A0A2I0WVJ7_9ASPA|nr:hypothetical protein MA16_Dca010917 [Dendrobium catenatum]
MVKGTELWDDSVLINAFDAAMKSYKVIFIFFPLFQLLSFIDMTRKRPLTSLQFCSSYGSRYFTGCRS